MCDVCGDSYQRRGGGGEKILRRFSHKTPHVFKELHLREELIRHFFSRLVRAERNKLFERVYLLIYRALSLITLGAW